jgi:hypothetical protein
MDMSSRFACQADRSPGTVGTTDLTYRRNVKIRSILATTAIAVAGLALSTGTSFASAPHNPSGCQQSQCKPGGNQGCKGKEDKCKPPVPVCTWGQEGHPWGEQCKPSCQHQWTQQDNDKCGPGLPPVGPPACTPVTLNVTSQGGVTVYLPEVGNPMVENGEEVVYAGIETFIITDVKNGAAGQTFELEGPIPADHGIWTEGGSAGDPVSWQLTTVCSSN